MRRFKHSSLPAASLIVLGGMAAPAFAVGINVDNVQVPYSENTTITGTVDGMKVTDSGVITGQIVLTVNNVGSTTQYTLPVWCVDLFHTINIGGSGYQFNEVPLSTDNSDNPSALTSTQIQEIGDLVAYGDAQMLSNPSNAISAEVQAAIWTVEYNNSAIGNNLTVGGGDVTSTTVNQVIMAAEAYGGSAGELMGLNGVQGQAYETAAARSIGSGLPSLLGIAGILFGANLLGRSKKRHSPGTAVAHVA